jgi:prepilin-type N-terminal cleavage/methylation domain-containing protein/prepilin-type processing-associated H-X9-DG protein
LNWIMDMAKMKIEMKSPKAVAYAFTLIELLVVISIISLLMAILIPGLGKARASAKRTTCKSNLRQIGVGIRSYLDDSRDLMPLACDYPWMSPDPNDQIFPPLPKCLKQQLKEPKVYICSADSDKKYYLMGKGGISYHYHGLEFGGRAISASRLAKQGVKEKNINIMEDFDPFHGKSGKSGAKNYLYADWHVGDISNQD